MAPIGDVTAAIDKSLAVGAVHRAGAASPKAKKNAELNS